MLTLSAIKIVAAVSIVIFYRGFTLLSRLFENTLVKAGSLLYTIAVVGMYSSDLLFFALGIYDGITVDIQSNTLLICALVSPVSEASLATNSTLVIPGAVFFFAGIVSIILRLRVILFYSRIIASKIIIPTV